jgi:transcription-repair coupling factor (superfamily II helicase)
VQSLARRLEKGGVLSCSGIAASAQPFVAALARHLFPLRPIVLVTEGLKTQESAQQDLATWLALETRGEVQNPKAKARAQASGDECQNPAPKIRDHVSHPTSQACSAPQPLFYPAWEVFPHEATLPHADVISERLETLVALTQYATRNTPLVPLIVTSVAALLQRTFPVGAVRERTRTLSRGDRLDPLDLVEWLEAQGYEPEAQVTQKGEIALRGGILDVYPLTSPWPVRAEFFGDELESLRQFDPLTQMSREEITKVTIPPAGELGLLKKPEGGGESPKSDTRNPKEVRNPKSEAGALGTLLDYLPP